MDRLSTTILAVILCALQSLTAQTPASAPKAASSTEQPATPAGKSSYPLDSFTDFSALMVGSIMEPGEGTVESHIYRSGKLMRMEGVESHGYLITDLSSLETYGVSESACMHDTHPYFRSSPFAASKPNAVVTRAASGKETVDGHSCQVEEVSITAPNPGAIPLKMKFWEADDLQGFPIKVEFIRAGGHNAIVHYKNVVLGPQDPTLFIHPKKCESFSQPGSMTPKVSPKSKKPSVSPPTTPQK